MIPGRSLQSIFAEMTGGRRRRRDEEHEPEDTAPAVPLHLQTLMGLPTAQRPARREKQQPLRLAHLFGIRSLNSSERAEAPAPRPRSASRPAPLAIPSPPAPEPMSEAARRAYNAAAKAENARWAAVMRSPFPAHLAPAAIQLLSGTNTSARAITETLAMIAETTPVPSAAGRSPSSGAERLAARVAEHQAAAAAAAVPSEEARATAEHADAADFAHFAAHTMAKVRSSTLHNRPVHSLRSAP